ncbi:hypothetical protein KKC60_04930 [Patescibacteria group bacterium]|nr:hypothetical protein [Patescibacteria group bacterium]
MKEIVVSVSGIESDMPIFRYLRKRRKCWLVSGEDDIATAIPRTHMSSAEVIFFQIDKWYSEEQVHGEYKKRKLVPDVCAQAQVNIGDSDFMHRYPNVTQWLNPTTNGWCEARFRATKDKHGYAIYIGHRSFSKEDMPCTSCNGYLQFTCKFSYHPEVCKEP